MSNLLNYKYEFPSFQNLVIDSSKLKFLEKLLEEKFEKK